MNNRTTVVTLIAATLAAGMFAAAAHGQAFHTVNAMDTGEEWFVTKAVYSNTVWVRTDKGGVERYASGVMLDPWNILVSGHQLFSNANGSRRGAVIAGRNGPQVSTNGEDGWRISATPVQLTRPCLSAFICVFVRLCTLRLCASFLTASSRGGHPQRGRRGG